MDGRAVFGFYYSWCNEKYSKIIADASMEAEESDYFCYTRRMTEC